MKSPWASVGQPKEVVPTTQLYPAEILAGTEIRLLTNEASSVSPAWVEWDCNEDAAALRFSVNGGAAQDAVRENEGRCYGDTASAQGLPYGIPLDEDNPTAISVTAADSGTGTQTYDYSLIWKPTTLNGKSWSEDEIVIRVNDSLLFTVDGDGDDYVELDVGNGGDLEFQGSANMKFPWKYTAAGQYSVTAWLNTEESGTLTVTVVDVDMHGHTACEIGFSRRKFVEVFPKNASARVSFAAADESLLGLNVIGPAVYGGVDGTMLHVCAVTRGAPVMQSRVGHACGPLIRAVEVDEYTTSNSAKDLIITQPSEDNGSTGTAIFTMNPLIVYPDNPDYNPIVVARFLSPGVTFEGGLLEKVVSTADFTLNEDGSGSYTFDVFLPPNHTNFCLYTTVSQRGSEEWETISFPDYNNGELIEFCADHLFWLHDSNYVMPLDHRQESVLMLKTSSNWSKRSFTVDLRNIYNAGGIPIGTLDVLLAVPQQKFAVGTRIGGSAGGKLEVANAGVLNLVPQGGAPTGYFPLPTGDYNIHVEFDSSHKCTLKQKLTIFSVVLPTEPHRVPFGGSDVGKAVVEPSSESLRVSYSIKPDSFGSASTKDGVNYVVSVSREPIDSATLEAYGNTSGGQELAATRQLLKVRVFDCKTNPSAIRTNGQETSKATAATTPYDRTLVWKITDADDHGYKIDSNGLISAKTPGQPCTPGTITVRATDSVFYDVYAEATLYLLQDYSVEILKPVGSLGSEASEKPEWLTTPCFHFDFQGVVKGSPGVYPIIAKGLITPSPPLGYKWEIEQEVGTLGNDTSAEPTFTPPDEPVAGWLKLKATVGNLDAGIQPDQKKLKIYKDHLTRDYENFSGCPNRTDASWTFSKYGSSFQMTDKWNCHGSARHHYQGGTSGDAANVSFSDTWTKVGPDFPNTEMTYPFSNEVKAALAAMMPGDIVLFYTDGGTHIHTHTSLGGVSCFGANNKPFEDGSPTPIWLWWTCTSEEYAASLVAREGLPDLNSVRFSAGMGYIQIRKKR